ncbi:precorrin-3B synthase [Kribbella sp. NPDC026611]|uniref:precorrin-3B synthase n=1 Tax=Kribbella sp. NPDC026611 TaxID=3154911 RepID=UPI0033CA4746
MARTETDRCPGVLAVHQAADGGLARVRVPGGVLSRHQLDVLRLASADLGDGRLELTSRGNVQIRGLDPAGPRALSDRLYTAGLLPSVPHERVRNILASPLSGLDSESRYDVMPVAAALDQALCARPALADLPGRFLFALDDGRGDLAQAQADVYVRALDESTALLTVGATPGLRAAWAEVPGLMLAAAEAFLVERDQEWRIAELPGGADRILARLSGAVADSPASRIGPAPADPLAPPQGTARAELLAPQSWVDGAGPASGVIEAGVHGSALVVTVPLGSLTQEQAAAVAECAEEVRLTPWRSVVVPAGTQGLLERVGLVTEPGSVWEGVSACAGRPGCAKALADVRADAQHLALQLRQDTARRLHVSGCERRCGKPADGFVDVVAVAGGYLVDGERM